MLIEHKFGTVASRLQSLATCLVFVAMFSAWTIPALAQDQGGIPGGIPGGTTGGTTGGDTTGGETAVPDAGQIPFGDTEFQASNEPPDLGDLLEAFNPEPEAVEFENLRIQPFVGRSRERYLEQGLVHPRSLLSTDSLGSNTGSGGGGNAFGNFQNQGTSLQPSGQNGFEVVRQSLRTRAVPRFVVNNRPTTRQVTSRFQQRLAQLQLTSGPESDVRVNLAGTLAILSGTVNSVEERNMIERMARLEPGIYRIENRLDIRQ
ncbi:MAG: BON domain-containing protein [Pirellulaceae bacterium]